MSRSLGTTGTIGGVGPIGSVVDAATEAPPRARLVTCLCLLDEIGREIAGVPRRYIGVGSSADPASAKTTSVATAIATRQWRTGSE
jgi:hypothetical protein